MPVVLSRPSQTTIVVVALLVAIVYPFCKVVEVVEVVVVGEVMRWK